MKRGTWGGFVLDLVGFWVIVVVVDQMINHGTNLSGWRVTQSLAVSWLFGALGFAALVNLMRRR